MKLFFLILSVLRSLYASDSLTNSAEYYYARHEYKQALDIWESVQKSQTELLLPILKIADLKFMLEGRNSARTVLLDALGKKGFEKGSQRLKLVAKLKELQSMFVSDEAQSSYLRAKPKFRFKDWNGALTHLTHALQLDPGNLLILSDKLQCEKNLLSWEKYTQTAKEIAEALPFDISATLPLLEAETYAGDFKSVKEAVLKNKELIEQNEEAKLYYAYALLELGEYQESLRVLKNTMEISKVNPHPIVYFILSKFSEKQGSQSESSKKVFETKFLTAAANFKTRSWDPFRIAEKTDL